MERSIKITQRLKDKWKKLENFFIVYINSQCHVLMTSNCNFLYQQNLIQKLIILWVQLKKF